MKFAGTAVRILWVVLLAAVPCQPSRPDPADDLRRLELQVHHAVNQERIRRKLPRLEWSESMAVEARRHAGNMARYRFFAHADPKRGDIDERLDRSGIQWRRCAENLYEQKGDRDNLVPFAVKAWLNSPGHRRNMLDSLFTDAGVGAAVRKDGTVLLVQNFISR